MFAEFEKTIHKRMAVGKALTQQEFNRIYSDLNVRYFGSGVAVDSDIDLEWARIPHFYSSLYVYKYATGLSVTVSLSH